MNISLKFEIPCCMSVNPLLRDAHVPCGYNLKAPVAYHWTDVPCQIFNIRIAVSILASRAKESDVMCRESVWISVRFGNRHVKSTRVLGLKPLHWPTVGSPLQGLHRLSPNADPVPSVCCKTSRGLPPTYRLPTACCHRRPLLPSAGPCCPPPALAALRRPLLPSALLPSAGPCCPPPAAPPAPAALRRPLLLPSAGPCCCPPPAPAALRLLCTACPPALAALAPPPVHCLPSTCCPPPDVHCLAAYYPAPAAHLPGPCWRRYRLPLSHRKGKHHHSKFR